MVGAAGGRRRAAGSSEEIFRAWTGLTDFGPEQLQVLGTPELTNVGRQDPARLLCVRCVRWVGVVGVVV